MNIAPLMRYGFERGPVEKHGAVVALAMPPPA
jgi:hypothetical protein